MDHLALANYRDDGWRDSFPVILEATAQSFYFNYEIYDLLHIREEAFPTLEFSGVEKPLVEIPQSGFLGHIFNTEQSKFVADRVGGNLSALRQVHEICIKKSENADLVNLT